MEFIISANTDIGTSKDTNQDSLSVKLLNTNQGKMVFAIVCDGMGGLEKGEVASSALVRVFHNWVMNELPALCRVPLEDRILRAQWEKIIRDQNERIKSYGAHQGVRLGTTVVVMLLTQNRFYIMNVGDSRAYEISDDIRRLTKDHTFVAHEVELGNMTEEQAEHDERRSVLLQCVGASDSVYPDMYTGYVKNNAAYLLCSDGFRHEILPQEIYGQLNPSLLESADVMNQNILNLIELNKQRQERDNISAVLIRTY